MRKLLFATVFAICASQSHAQVFDPNGSLHVDHWAMGGMWPVAQWDNLTGSYVSGTKFNASGSVFYQGVNDWTSFALTTIWWDTLIDITKYSGTITVNTVGMFSGTPSNPNDGMWVQMDQGACPKNFADPDSFSLIVDQQCPVNGSAPFNSTVTMANPYYGISTPLYGFGLAIRTEGNFNNGTAEVHLPFSVTFNDPVPEPATLLVLGSGVFAICRRRKKI